MYSKKYPCGILGIISLGIKQEIFVVNRAPGNTYSKSSEIS